MKNVTGAILRISGIVAGSLLGLLLLALLLLQWNVDPLANRLIEATNEQIEGEIQLEDADLRLLRFLPNITLQLSGVSLRENKSENDKEILRVDRLLVAINPFRLLGNEISLAALELDGGAAQLIMYPDSSSNISRALGPLLKKSDPPEEAEPEEEPSSPLDIEVKRLMIQNFDLGAENQLSGLRVKATLSELNDRLLYDKAQIENQLTLNLQLNELADSTGTLLSEQEIGLDTDLFLDRTSLVASIRKCLLSLNGAGFRVSGTYDFANLGDAQLNFRTENVQLDLFSLLTKDLLLLPAERLNLEGQLALQGVLEGQTLGEKLPFLEANLSTEGVRIFDKEQEEYLVENLEMQVYFTTGRSPDLSKMELEIDTLNLEFLDGFIRGKAFLHDRTRPQLALRLLADNNMQKVQQMLNPKKISGLKGRLKTTIDIRAVLDSESGKYQRDFGSSSIRWENGAFLLPEQDVRADLINIELQGKSNSFQISNINLIRGESDFQLSGQLDNALTYLLKDPTDLQGKLELKMRKLRLYDFVDSTLIPGVAPELYDLKTQVSVRAPYQALQQGKVLFSESVLALDHFSTESNFFARIEEIKGEFRPQYYEVRLDNWSGLLGESDIRFNLRLSSEKNLFQRGVKLYDLRLDYDFSSNSVRAADFFTFMDQFYLPESYRDESLKNFRLKGFVQAERPDSVEYTKIPNLEFDVEKLDLQLSSFPVAFQDFQLILLKKERDAIIRTFEGRIGKSDFSLSGELANFFVPPNEEPRPLIGNLELKADRISTENFLDASAVLDFAPELYDLNTRIELHVPVQARKKDQLSGTWMELTNFSTRSNFMADVKRIQGRVSIEEEDVLLENWIGRLGESQVDLDLAFRNLPPVWGQSSAVSEITLDYQVQAQRVRAKDLFTFRDSFYFPEQFREEELQGLLLAGQVKSSGRKGDPESELRLQVDQLRWRLTLFPVAFRDFKVDMSVKPGQTLLKTFEGKIGRSDFAITGRTAHLQALAGEGSGTPEVEVKVASRRLDLNELMLLTLPTLEEAARIEQEGETSSVPAKEVGTEELPDSAELARFNPFELPLPEGLFELRIDSLVYQQSVIKDISGTLRTHTSRKVELESLRSRFAGGEVQMSGGVDLSDPDSAMMTVSAEVARADFGQLTDTILYGEKGIVPADHFRGVFNTRAEITTRIRPDLSLDVTKAEGKVDLSFKDGEVLDFAPLQMLSDIMGSKDLSQVRFGELENTLELEDGYVFIPKMDINSTLGAIRITGFQYFNNEMEYLVQIPFSLVTSVGWGALTGKQRKEDAEPDEIIKMKDGGVRINVRIVGTPDDYSIKLGKGETFKAIEKEEKKAAKEKRKKRNEK